MTLCDDSCCCCFTWPEPFHPLLFDITFTILWAIMRFTLTSIYSFCIFSPTYHRAICDTFILAFCYLLGLSCCLVFLLLSVLLMDNIGRQMFFVVNVVVAVVQVLQIWQGIFYLQVFHCLHSLIFLVLQQVLMIWGGVFYAQAFFTLHSFPTFFIQPGFIGFSQGTGSSTTKDTGIHAEVWNIVTIQLFVWITQQPNKRIIVGRFYLCASVNHETL